MLFKTKRPQFQDLNLPFQREKVSFWKKSTVQADFGLRRVSFSDKKRAFIDVKSKDILDKKTKVAFKNKTSFWV